MLDDTCLKKGSNSRPLNLARNDTHALRRAAEVRESRRTEFRRKKSTHDEKRFRAFASFLPTTTQICDFSTMHFSTIVLAFAGLAGFVAAQGTASVSLRLLFEIFDGI